MANDVSAAPKVSIVVCTYNGEQFLAEQLDSLLHQTYPNLEILICDDGSTDRTLDIATEYARKDQRIRLHVNERNLGYNLNFAKAFTLADGPFIAISDQDDIWKSNKIESMMPGFTSEQVMLVHCQSVRFEERPPEADRYTARNIFQGSNVRQLMFFNTIAGHNMIFRKKLLTQIKDFPEGVFYDWWLALHAAIAGKVVGLHDVLTFHRMHGSNVTLGKKDEKKQTRAKADERRRTLKELMKTGLLNGNDQVFAQQLLAALDTLQGKNFSSALFKFLFKHAATLFFFKKKKWPSLSHLKIAYRLSFAK